MSSDATNWLKAIENQQIAKRAHEIYRQNGCRQGHDLENWLQAEAELRRDLGQIQVATDPEIVITASRAHNGELHVKSIAFRTPRSTGTPRNVPAAAGTQTNTQN